MSRLEILGIIPARGGSKGVRRKNVRPLGGHPLLCYTIAAALGSRLLTRVVVSTEDEEIAQVAAQAGSDVIRRPAELAQDDSPTLPAAQHAVREIEAKIGRALDHVVILQATTPFRNAEDIDTCLEKLIGSGADCVVSVRHAHEVHAAKLKRMEDDRLLPYVIEEIEGIRRQDLPACYVRNGGIYATRRDVLMKQNSIFGSDVRACVMPDERSVDINTEVDFLLAEALLDRGLVPRLKT